MKRVLIAGAGSYIGTALEKTLQEKPDEYQVAVLDMENENWQQHSFQSYDSVVFVAGLAHRKEHKGELALYRKVNTELPVKAARKAKKEGVSQFIFLSSMSIYGKQTGRITASTVPSPVNYYGKSKWEAEQKLLTLAEEGFQIAILRPPMVYGAGCKGNYALLRKFALKTPFFPDYPNYRSMIYIGNLTAVLERLLENGSGGQYLPQNMAYVSTKQMVEEITACHGRKIRFCKWFNPVIRLLERRFSLFQKVFGDLVYTKKRNVEPSWLPYPNFSETIRLTEGKGEEEGEFL